MTEAVPNPGPGAPDIISQELTDSRPRQTVTPEISTSENTYDSESYLSIETGQKLSRLGHISAVSIAGLGFFAMQQEHVQSGGLLLMMSINLGFTAYAIKEDTALKRLA
jgi:hypothetical protein